MARILASTVSLLVAAAAFAEPTAVRFPDQTTEAALQDFDPGFPPILITNMSSQEAGAIEVGLSFDVADGAGNPTCGLDLVEGARAPSGPWTVGPLVCVGVLQPLPFGTPGLFSPPDCFDCDFSGDWPSELVFRTEQRSVYILRHRPDTGSDWTYGWVVAESILLENLLCDAATVGCNATLPFANIVAAGFASEPGGPIAVGAGLCESDLTFDGILDLADLQLFVATFLNQQAIADRNADGVYDLADVQAFVSGFSAGCP